MSHELGPEARDLIEQACREERAPEAHELRRIRNNVLFGVAPTAVLLGAGEAAAAAGKLSVLSLVGVAGKGALLGTAVALAGYAVQRVESRSLPPPSAVLPVARLETPALPPAASRASVSPALPAPVPPATSPAARATLEKNPSTSTTAAPPGEPLPSEASMSGSAELLEEVENLRRVQEHLRAGRGAEALRVLDASSSRLGQGQLRQERLAAEVFASCQSGQTQRAREAARRFLKENPATPSAARLKTSCVGEELDLP
jgi:hypothetical protein